MKKIDIKKPVQLIKFDENKNALITNEAIQLFKSFNTSELHIVTVVGRYRTGKSYILNRILLNRNSGFQVGSTINACTKGLWMWPQLVQIKVGDKIKDCLIVDTQGLGSLQQGQNTDIKIFLLALLLSSFLIYNSVGSIDEKSLQSLNLVVNLANLLQKQSNYDTQQMINCFPSFLWLVRDFSLKLQNQRGQIITSQDYLQNALKSQKGISKGNQRKNQIRKQLRTFFHDRDCFTLIRPTQNENDLQNLSSISQKKLRPEFLNLINELKERVYQNIKPKKIKGKSLTPQGFIELCKYFTQAINSGKLPSINSHWQNLCVNQSSRIIEKFRDAHYDKLKAFQCDQQKLKDYHLALLKKGELQIQKSFLGKLQKQLSKQRLSKTLNEIYLIYTSQIKQETYGKAKQIIKTAFQEIIEDFKQKKLESFEDIFAKFEQIKDKYKKDTRIYEEFYQNSKDVFNEFIRYLQQNWQKEHAVLNCKTFMLENQIQKFQKQRNTKIDQLELQLRRTEQKMYKLQMQLNSNKAENKIFRREIEQITEQNVTLRNQIEGIANYQDQIKQLNQFKQQAIKQIDQLTDQKNKFEIKCIKLEQNLKQSHIKQRKTIRQAQILKTKCSEYLQTNIELNQKLDELQNKIYQQEQNLRKNNIKYTDKQMPQFVKELNHKIEELQCCIKIYEAQKKNLTELLKSQKQINETLLKTNHNSNFFSLKKSYNIETQNNCKLKAKLQELQKVICYATAYECPLCKKKLEKQQIKHHFQACNKNIQFDVSYIFNGQAQLQFIIHVTINERQWTIQKSLQSIRKFLKHIKKSNQIFQSHSQQYGQNAINFNEQRRLYLDELIYEMRQEILTQPIFIQFFACDIHLLRKQNKKTVKIPKISLEEIQQQKYNQQNLMKTTRFTKKTFRFNDLS